MLLQSRSGTEDAPYISACPHGGDGYILSRLLANYCACMARQSPLAVACSSPQHCIRRTSSHLTYIHTSLGGLERGCEGFSRLRPPCARQASVCSCMMQPTHNLTYCVFLDAHGLHGVTLSLVPCLPGSPRCAEDDAATGADHVHALSSNGSSPRFLSFVCDARVRVACVCVCVLPTYLLQYRYDKQTQTGV